MQRPTDYERPRRGERRDDYYGQGETNYRESEQFERGSERGNDAWRYGEQRYGEPGSRGSYRAEQERGGRGPESTSGYPETQRGYGPPFSSQYYGSRGSSGYAGDYQPNWGQAGRQQSDWNEPDRDRDYGSQGYGGQGQRGSGYGQRQGGSGDYSQSQGGYGQGQGAYGGGYNWGGPQRSWQGDSAGGAYGSRSAEQRRWGNGPKGYTRSDERLKEEISDRLMATAEIDSSEIEVEVSGGEVTLKGGVSSRQDKFAAEQIAEAVMGVKDVSNQLRVQRNDSSSRGRNESRSGESSAQSASDSSSNYKRR